LRYFPALLPSGHKSSICAYDSQICWMTVCGTSTWCCSEFRVARNDTTCNMGVGIVWYSYYRASLCWCFLMYYLLPFSWLMKLEWQNQKPTKCDQHSWHMHAYVHHESTSSFRASH